MENELHGKALATFAELATLRMLVEALIARQPEDTQIYTVIEFDTQCENMLASMLGSTAREPLLAAMQAAIRLQRLRLEGAGIAPPTLRE